MVKKSPSASDRFMALSDTEKRRLSDEFDQEFTIDRTRPLTAAERRQWSAAKKKAKSPRRAKADKVISLRIEGALLKQADAAAKLRGISRAQLVAESLRQILAG